MQEKQILTWLLLFRCATENSTGRPRAAGSPKAFDRPASNANVEAEFIVTKRAKRKPR